MQYNLLQILKQKLVYQYIFFLDVKFCYPNCLPSLGLGSGGVASRIIGVTQGVVLRPYFCLREEGIKKTLQVNDQGPVVLEATEVTRAQ